MFEFIKELIVPSNFCFALAMLGAVLWILPRTRRIGGSIIVAAAAILLTLSFGKTAALLLSPLEYEYPYVAGPTSGTEAPKAIVVLAGYAADYSPIPLSSRANSSALYRVVEAVHLRRYCGDCRVIVSGFDPTVKVMSELLLTLGVPLEQLELDTLASNTAASAENLKSSLRNDPFYLVTSASHMRRSMGAFKKQGLNPIPAPTDYQFPKSIAHNNWRPTPYHLLCSDLAIREYVGTWWYRLRGKL